jgi:hypothetical protein
MEQDMEFVPNEMGKSRRSMSIHSICDPLASSISTLSDQDSEATLNVNERMSMDGELPKYDSLSPSEEQAIRALEDLRAGIILFFTCPRHVLIFCVRLDDVSTTESTRLFKPSTELLDRQYCSKSMGPGKKL